MQANEYLEQSGRTAAEGRSANLTLLGGNVKNLYNQMIDVAKAGRQADLLKRALFYSDPKIEDRKAKSTTEIEILTALVDQMPDQPEAKEPDLVHAALGMASEMGEIIEEILTAHAEGREVDLVNLMEEAGDNQWYVALLLRRAGYSFEETMQKNIDKLRVRYPEKFGQEYAVNRNLEAERSVLESTN